MFKYRLKNPFKLKRYPRKRYSPKPSFKDLHSLERDIQRLEQKVEALIKFSGFDTVNGVIMDEEDAKKYKAQHNHFTF
tara:strand:+ start:380 stop:613 length:234 start_codon:yes stop_codon:yes gene_type:complete